MNTVKNLEIHEALARKIYPTAAPELKAILEKTFSKEFFSLSLKERLNKWEHVAAEYGIDPVNSLPYPDPTKEDGFPKIQYTNGSYSDPVADKKSQNALFKMTLITRLFNAGKKVDYDDSGQDKYYGWFKKRPAGFGFDGVSTLYVRTTTHVGPRLSFLDIDDCRHVCQHPEFSKIFDEYYSQ